MTSRKREADRTAAHCVVLALFVAFLPAFAAALYAEAFAEADSSPALLERAPPALLERQRLSPLARPGAKAGLLTLLVTAPAGIVIGWTLRRVLTR